MVKTEDIVTQFPLRKSHKQQFLMEVKQYAEHLGYSVRTESGFLLIGDPKQASCILSCGTAVSGVAAWLEILRTFPENQRHKVCFLLPAGKTFFGKHSVTGKLMIHLDHIGDGTHLRMYPSSQLKSDRPLLTSLYRACGYFGNRDLLVEEGRKPLFLKMARGCPNAVSICALQQRKKRLRYPRKTQNTTIDETNVNILRAALTTYICCSEVN